MEKQVAVRFTKQDLAKIDEIRKALAKVWPDQPTISTVLRYCLIFTYEVGGGKKGDPRLDVLSMATFEWGKKKGE